MPETPTTSDEADRSSSQSLQSRTFEELVTELEQVARSMDAPELGIEQAADLYERAGALHRAAAERLAQVQGRLEALRRQDDPSS